MQVPGVANVAIWGERIKLPQVQVDPKRMAEQGVTVEEVDGDHVRGLGRRWLLHSRQRQCHWHRRLYWPNQRVHIRPSVD
jgi:hypothetical protein